MKYRTIYNEWLLYDGLSNENRMELEKIQNLDDEIMDRFCENLKFGTGGMRGIIGMGTNRINVYTIRRATQGLANYLNSLKNSDNNSVVIAYDSRKFSKLFAIEASLILSANGIKVFLFDSLRPTPELSFATRYLKCDAGVVITASHNPSEYNGYKVYNSDGGQITTDIADKLSMEIDKVDFFENVNILTLEEAVSNGLVEYISTKIDDAYIAKIKKLSIRKTSNHKVKIVYTPIHGSGLELVKRILNEEGFNDLHIVDSQKKPDGNFPTVKAPNPEEKDALSLGIELAESIGADIVIGTDPDADRLGAAVKCENDDYKMLTGNQIGALLTYYILSNKQSVNNRDIVIKTIVTSELGTKIAEDFGATVVETLTGFKYIGEKIKEYEGNNEKNFLFGYEESYGYLAGTFVRDKDAVFASMLFSEMVAYYKEQNMTILNVLDVLYEKYGYFTDALDSYIFAGIGGQEQIKRIMKNFRNLELLHVKFENLYAMEDYKELQRYKFGAKEYEVISFSRADVVKIFLLDGSWIAVRPSGTEPKLKIYYSALAETRVLSAGRLERMKNSIKNIMEA